MNRQFTTDGCTNEKRFFFASAGGKAASWADIRQVFIL